MKIKLTEGQIQRLKLIFEDIDKESEGIDKESDSLENTIANSIYKIDENMSYEDFAIAVAKVLFNKYGKHNFTPFMTVLHRELEIK
jgi:hypothetical protein